MDKLKGMAEKLGGGGSGAGHSAGHSDPNKEDYGDKALDFIEQKTGHAQSRQTNEKITDKARDFYEKQTGSKVSDKFSN